MKKVLSLLMVLCLVVGMMPVAASAAGSFGKTERSVALVDGTYYDNLNDAFSAAAKAENSTVTLVNNVVLGKKIIIGKSLTLDLKEYTIQASSTSEYCMFKVNGSGKFTIQGNGTIDASTGEADVQTAISVEDTTASVNIISGTIIGKYCGVKVNEGTANISGGTVQYTTDMDTSSAVYISGQSSSAEISGNAQIVGKNAAVRVYGGELNVKDSATLEGNFGVMLFNKNSQNSDKVPHASFTMSGGTITATSGFALSGNNLQSAQCSAKITGGKLEQTSGETCIYWPMEGNLTIGGTAVVEGGSAIEAKMGTIEIQGNAQLIGNGKYLDEEPPHGYSQADGSAILVSAQMYGANNGQYIKSPALTVKIEGGTLTSTNGNAVTVYNTEEIKVQTAAVTVSGGTLTPAEGRAVVQVTNQSDSNVTSPTESGENYYTVETKASETTVTISSEVAGFAADLGNKTGFYNSLSDALHVAADMEEGTTVYMMKSSDDKIDRGALADNVTLTAVQGVKPQLYSEDPNSVIKQTTDPTSGNTTYTVVSKDSTGDDFPEISLPKVKVMADKTTAYTGETITLTASISSTSNSPQIIWYKDGEIISNATGTTLKVTESGTYYAIVRVSVTDSNAVYYDEVKSNSVACTLIESTPVTPSTPTYANTVSDTENGKVTASPTRPKEGATVTITTTPDKGYEVGSVSVTDADGKAVAVTNAGNGKYTFKQPDSKVTIKVTFVWDNPFTDVKSTAWYYNAVKYVYENNLMAGTGDTTFDPEVSLTRAMTAQILYNLEGQPKVDEEATFSDMTEAPTWSVDAIAWAQDTGVVAGMGDNEFAPNAKVTREQFAQMMYNYAKYKKYDLTKTGDLSKFPDDGSVSDWAETAMSWANGNGLINGHEDSGLIDPAGNTIRGQAASIIMNFDKNVVK